MSERYPLEAVRGLRAEEEDAAQRAVADALARLEAASRRVEEAHRAVSVHRDETARVLAAENGRPLWEARAVDAVRAREWRRRRATELSALAEALTRAASERETAEACVERAREALASAARERQAIEKHRERWQLEVRRRAEAREEADAESPRGGAPRR